MHVDQPLAGELGRDRPQRQALAGLGVAPMKPLGKGDELGVHLAM